MTRKTLLTLAVLTALAAGTAFAATTPASSAPVADGQPAPRAKLDSNGDGSVDRAEAAKHPRLAGKFDELDKNKDGKLSKEEMPRHGDRKHGGDGHGPRGEDRREAMAKLDTDKDGRISRTEAAAGEGKLASRFDEMDANKDGFIDRADREIHAKQRSDEWFAKADTDKDGKLSRAEVDAAKPKHGERGGPRPPMTPEEPTN